MFSTKSNSENMLYFSVEIKNCICGLRVVFRLQPKDKNYPPQMTTCYPKF